MLLLSLMILSLNVYQRLALLDSRVIRLHSKLAAGNLTQPQQAKYAEMLSKTLTERYYILEDIE